MTRPWQPGATIVLQEVWRGRLWSARPVTVAVDEGDFLALWQPRGTSCRAPAIPRTRERSPNRATRIMGILAHQDWMLVPREWDVSNLWLMEAHAGHAVWASWLPDGGFMGWYVNLQEPFRRSGNRVQTMDLMLDIVVTPDRRWQWKDDDDLRAMVEWQLIDEARAAEIREEGERVIARLEANEPPFCEPWPEWRPDSSWGLPALPPGWDEV